MAWPIPDFYVWSENFKSGEESNKDCEPLAQSTVFAKMVRGHAKEVSQQKNAAKQAEKAKSVKREGSEVSVDFC